MNLLPLPVVLAWMGTPEDIARCREARCASHSDKHMCIASKDCFFQHNVRTHGRHAMHMYYACIDLCP